MLGRIVLEAGQSYEISRGGVAVVQALREAIVALRAPPCPRLESGSRHGSSGYGARGLRARLTGIQLLRSRGPADVG